MAKTNTKPTFAEDVAARQERENSWQSLHAEAKFNGKSMVKSLEELADSTFPADAYNSNAYQEAIAKSLTETISPEVGVKDFWEAMSKNGCKTLRIEFGHLNFYDAKNQKMDITPYTQPIVFEAHSSYYRERQAQREARIMEARKQLQDLLKEIHKR
ncbi:hypothetical protein IT411_00570 [Candidatus Peregrinibacteria bacterium]|nr:hypothetical protein [Candidatus Peregrinibacteria bacterium]